MFVLEGSSYHAESWESFEEKEKMRAMRANSATCSYQLQQPAIDRKAVKIHSPRFACLTFSKQLLCLLSGEGE